MSPPPAPIPDPAHAIEATVDGFVIADYDGAIDPRTLRLAISQYAPPPLRIADCEFVQVEGLHVRFGGNLAVRIETSSDVVLDHVDVRAGSGGIFFGGNTRVHLRHCAVDGGRPTWLFRSDIKDGYLVCGEDGSVIENNLAAGTHDALLAGAATDVDTVIEYCEFVSGHDLALFGQRTTFHHNWVHNVHDDELIVDRGGTTDLQVHQNVITNCLMAISLARDTASSLGESRSVHRNLIDLREPTTSIRPRPDGHLVGGNDDTPVDGVFRYGQLYKSNSPDGPMDFFHNTCLVRRLHGPTGFGLFRGAGPDDKVRRSVDNVFVDVTPSIAAGSDYVTAYLPPPDFSGPTDGNCYVQVGGPARNLLRHQRFGEAPNEVDGAAFADLAPGEIGGLDVGVDGRRQFPKDPGTQHKPGQCL